MDGAGGGGAYVDEIIAQRVYVDEAGNPGSAPVTLYHLVDENFNVVGLTDEFGNLVAQYTYYPYGRVRSAELVANVPSNRTPEQWLRTLGAARLNRIGHQGLMAERLDKPWGEALCTDTTEPWGGIVNNNLIGGEPSASYKSIYHSRNRIYDPDLGRFTSSDPNGVGVPVLSSAVYGGMAVGAQDVSADYWSHYGDGMNVHGAYKANPLRENDPVGLYSGEEFWEDTEDVAEFAWNAYQTIDSFGDVHGLVQGMAQELVEQYSANLEDDVNWALDWSRPDNDYSRLDSKWVPVALARGALRHFGGDYWQEFLSGDEASGPAMAASFKGSFKAVGGKIRKVGSNNKFLRIFMKRFKAVKVVSGKNHFSLNSDGMRHILERHHPRVWNGSIKAGQTFFDHRMEFDEVLEAIKDVAQQNRAAMEKIGRGQGTVIGNYGGRLYKLGVIDGKIRQFYPLP